MTDALIETVEKKYRRSQDLPLRIGDTVVVTLRIVEGDKERLQDFEGVVIARKGRGLNEMFTVRRLVGNEGVERTFPLHSPKIVAIRTVRSGRVRRSKLYFLRQRVGRARKLRERRTASEARKPAEAAASDGQAGAATPQPGATPPQTPRRRGKDKTALATAT